MLFLLICILTVFDHRDGRGGVKLNRVEGVAKGARKLAKCAEACRYDGVHWSRLLEIVLKRETFIVSFSNYCEMFQ